MLEPEMNLWLIESASQPFDKPIYNHFMHMHDFETLQVSHDMLYLTYESPLLEFNGYIPVVHQPTYIDMGNAIHFNPSPIFVPGPSSAALLGLAMLAILKRKVRYT